VNFKYFVIVLAFTSDGTQDEELDNKMGKASAVMRALKFSIFMKRELSKKAKLSVFVPILTYGHASWVVTERIRSQGQAYEMRFLLRFEGITLFNKARTVALKLENL